MVTTTHVVAYALHTSSPYIKHDSASSHSGVHMTTPLSLAPDDTHGSQVIPKLVNL